MSTKALARRLRQMQAGRPAFVTGTTLAAAAGGQVQVNVGADRIVTAIVPGTFRTEVAAGVSVRMTRVENTHTIDSILDTLPAPAVTAPPSASSISPLTMSDALGFTAAGFDNTGFTSQDFQAALYAEYLKGVLNDAIDVINNHQATIASLKATVNSLRTTVAEQRTALIEQGRIT